MTLKPDFKATCTHAADMGGYFLAGLADHQHETSDYITFQRAHQFDAQDFRLGHDDVYIERNDQVYSCYGGMRSVVLFPDRLHIDFDDRGAGFMRGIAAMDVLFDFSRERFEALRAGLHRCFSGFAYFHDQPGSPFDMSGHSAEPGAGIPQAGICEEDDGQPVILH